MGRDVLLLVGEGGAMEPAVRAAAGLAAVPDVWHLTALGLGAVPLYQDYLLGTVLTDTYASALLTEQDLTGQRIAAVTAQLGRAGVVVDAQILVSDIDLLPGNAAARARVFDVVMMSDRASATNPRLWDQLTHSLLFESGRPLLLLPDSATLTLPVRQIAVAWNASREASRAVHDALAVFAHLERVEIICVDPVGEQDGEPGADLAAHLARRGLVVELHQMTSIGKPVGDVVQARALELGAQALVMGAFGHSRLRQFLLGGVTRDVVERCALPVFLSH